MKPVEREDCPCAPMAIIPGPAVYPGSITFSKGAHEFRFIPQIFTYYCIYCLKEITRKAS